MALLYGNMRPVINIPPYRTRMSKVKGSKGRATIGPVTNTITSLGAGLVGHDKA